MNLYKFFKFELCPDTDQKQKIKQFCGSTRFIMNHALVWHEQLRENSRNLRFNAQDAIKLLSIWEKSFSWLANCPPQILQEALKDLERSFKKFYKYGFGYPNFKKKGIKESFRIKEDFSIDEFNNRIYLPMLGWIKYRNDRKISGTVKSITVFFKNQRVFISILTSNNHISSIKKEGNPIGTDLGIARFDTFSNNTMCTPLNIYKKSREKFISLNTRLKNKRNFSKNRQKLKTVDGYAKNWNCYKDVLRKVSTDLSNKYYSPIYIKNLKIGNMAQSGQIILKTNQKNLSNKKELNNAIMDQAWHEFRKILGYKLLWKGGDTIAGSAVNTGKKCSVCRSISILNSKIRSQFECSHCGYRNYENSVGAMNILLRDKAMSRRQYVN